MSHARARRSEGVKTILVTAGGSASEIEPSSSISSIRRCWLTLKLMLCSRQWMPVPVFVNEVFRRHFAEGAKPLHTIGAHPDEIARDHWIPEIAEPINPAPFQHDEAVLHHMHFDHAERSPGLVDHRVYREIKRHFVRKQALHLEVRIFSERVRGNRIFVRDD